MSASDLVTVRELLLYLCVFCSMLFLNYKYFFRVWDPFGDTRANIELATIVWIFRL